VFSIFLKSENYFKGEVFGKEKRNCIPRDYFGHSCFAFSPDSVNSWKLSCLL